MQCTPWRTHLLRVSLALLALLLLPLPDAALLPRLHLLRSLLAPPCPPFSSSSPLPPALLDLAASPLLWPGVQAGTQATAHEREGDFSSFLYAEGGSLFFLDQFGPVCFTRAFYATSDDLWLPESSFYGAAELIVEVDGEVALVAAADLLFNGTSPPLLQQLPAGSLAASIPSYFSRGGNVLQAPLCASRRLRMAWRFPLARVAKLRFSDGEETVLPQATAELLAMVNGSAAALLSQSDSCIADSTECLLKMYIDVGFVRPPQNEASGLPRGWLPFSRPSSEAAPRAPAKAEAAAAAPPKALGQWDITHGFPATLARLEGAADAKLSEARCGKLSLDTPLLPVFSAAGAGTLLALVLEFSPADREEEGSGLGASEAEAAAAALLHSPRLMLEAFWDVAPELWRGPSGEGGAFITPLASLFGPASLGYGGDARPIAPSAQAAFGTVQNGSRSMGYVFFPAPFWASARVALRLVPEKGQPEEGLGVRVCTRALATRHAAAAGPPTGTAGSCAHGLDASPGAELPAASAGYLQAQAHDFFIEKGKDGVWLALSGVRGKLVGVTNFLEARRGDYPSSVVEGDVRAFVDGNGSPATWDSGFEDFFNGAHTYVFAPQRTGEALFAHQRRDTDRFMAHASSACISAGGVCPPWLSKLHPDCDLWSTRTLLLDAVPFQHSIDLVLEGFFGQFEMVQSRGLAIYYGAAAPAPPLLSDLVYPGAEVYEPPLQQKHGYTVALPPGANAAPLRRYDHTSAFAGRGEPPSVEDGSCPIRTPGKGAGGVDYHNCPSPLLALPVLLLPAGAVARFRVRVDRGAARVALRRVFDARFSVQRAHLSVEGVGLGLVGSSERAFSHLNTDWREAVVHLPPQLTRGKEWLSVEVEALGDEEAAAAGGGRLYPEAQKGEEWTEARWTAVSYFA